MAYQVLARKWRPTRFSEVVGQEHVTTTLENAIRTGRLAHAFLFCGPRGVGKTTTARILAKCLNCETATDGPVAEPCNQCSSCQETAEGRSLDILEIDGASNRGIDEIRDLRENVRYAPSGGRAKVYIIDEVHMLTKEAFNALLKTLEEPPPSVYFVFATTEIHKVPATIRSRCQRYDFHRIATEQIEATLAQLAKSEKFDADPMALKELARSAEGGLRDAQSLLDQAAAVGQGKITLEGVRSLLGEAEEEAMLAIVQAASDGDTGAAFVRLQELLDRGLDPGRVATSLTQALRDLLVVQTAPKNATSLGVRADLEDDYRAVAKSLSVAKLTALLSLASRTVSDLRRSARPRLTLEVALARMSRLQDSGELSELAERVERLRRELGGDGGGDPALRPPPPPSGAPSSSGSPQGGAAPPATRTSGKTTAKKPASPPPATSRSGSPSGASASGRASRKPAWEEDVPPEEPPLPDGPPPASLDEAEAPRRSARPRASRTAAAPVVAAREEAAGDFATDAAAAADSDIPESALPSSAPADRVAPGDPAAAPASATASAAAELWKGLLARVSQRKTMLGSFLEHGAATDWDGDTLSTVFENNYYEGMVKRHENFSIVHEELKALVGGPATLRVRVGAVPRSGRAAGSAAAEEDATPKPTNPRDLLDDNPGLKRAIHDLGGQLMQGGS